MNRMRKQLSRWPLSALALSILVALALAACGQRGPLYLPDEEQAVQPAGQADEDELEDDDARPQKG